ncbi:hypothetical protein [Bacillus sp. 1NLA3E]|uniref:hypothetical protein n=1 Tax=Bacillus sp. 1NLA3E TaxID=666686 RepID=UPI000247E851|nr:hypothetical protein [Bacillus sp. 1NLA3E]AGK51946.1 hypothetical protein B1NLA3E_00810 [Bacillus sp. 1NLA3E]
MATLFIILEFTINVRSFFTRVSRLVFLGKSKEAVVVVDHQWPMFYPCVYMFAIYDAYKYADGENPRFSFVPFAFTADFVTIGLIYSPNIILGISFSPIWIQMLSLIPVLGIEFIIRHIIIKITSRPNSVEDKESPSSMKGRTLLLLF